MIRVILKEDVAGSLEALPDLLKKIPLKPNERLEALDQSVGEISDGDVKDALATEAIIVGFRTEANKAAETLARTHGVRIITNDVIYKLTEEIEKAFADAVEEEGTLGTLCLAHGLAFCCVGCRDNSQLNSGEAIALEGAKQNW